MNQALKDFYAYWGEWFAQPEVEKLKHERKPGRGGFYKLGSEGPGLAGSKDAGKEYFHWRLYADHPDCAVPGYPQSATEKLFMDCWLEARAWLDDRGLGDLSELPIENHVLRILHYLPSENEVVGQAHRDFDLLTVSVEGTAPGLEVLDGYEPEDRACWVPQEEGIQVGEMLEIYGQVPTVEGSPSRFPATTHRVRTPPNTDRLKAVFFYNAPPDFVLRPGLTAHQYLYEPESGYGVLVKAGTYGVGK